MKKIIAQQISITGVVQGVGFRPFVYNLAQDMHLHGWVLNHSGGVDIEVEGSPKQLTAFVDALRSEAPTLAHIESLETQPAPTQGHTTFEIRRSQRQAGQYQLISPDVATCPDCLRELLDPQDHRYRYPFINCTNCGPRFTIIDDIPYDRPNTTMKGFPLCEDCRTEYQNPRDRRFHAQPNACPVCGPHIWLTDSRGEPLAAGEQHTDNEAVLKKAKTLLLAGKILAIKGLGGFHLACDATNPAAVRRLRKRKRRPHKPFAVMVATPQEAQAHVHVTAQAAELFASPQCPIVLLDRQSHSTIAENVAPQSRTLGVMIAYTPLHHILLRDVDRPLVMTSGNVSEEPIAKDNDEALRRLAPLADAFLLHNRDIYARYDDSVWSITAAGGAQPLRRARGYAPFPVRLPFKIERIFAAGPLLKNTFTLTRDNYAFLSQHIGDMENLETLEHYEAALQTYTHLFRLEPQLVACDLHPDYLSTRFAGSYAREKGLPEPFQVQHHHAHIAACLADNGHTREEGDVIGVALDGTGYGSDGAIWGGEWLVGNYSGFRRAAQLEYMPLPGGDAAIRQPWRIAAAYLYTLFGADGFPSGQFCPSEAVLIRQQIERGINTPQTSSMGRLFDAVSALLGICHKASYEAQAAIELENVAARGQAQTGYPFTVQQDETGPWHVGLRELFDALLYDMEKDVPPPDIARRFHHTVAQMVLQICARLRDETNINTLALSGGVFQNQLLLNLTVPQLETAGFVVLQHRQVPCNDGGVSLGQAVLAQHQYQEKT